MGSFLHYTRYNNAGVWCLPSAMGEMNEEVPASQSDSESSNLSLECATEVGADNRKASKCRWIGCGRWFSHLDMLASHVTRVHATCGEGGLFYCGWEGCSRGDRGFNARYKMLVHVRTHTNEKPHHCFKCDKSFSRAENLKIHARSHTGERPYVCPVPGCGKAYSNSSDRFKHTRTHSVDKPYICKVPGCPKRYTDPSSLRKHVKTYRHYPGVSQEQSNNHMPEAPPVDKRSSQSNCYTYNCENENMDNDSVYSCSKRTAIPSSYMHVTDSNVVVPQVYNGTLATDSELTSFSADNGQCIGSCCAGAEYSLFHSWLSLWRQPLLHTSAMTEEQDLPLDLTVHRATART